LTKQYKGGYDRQSVLSAAGKLSCIKAALKRCTRTEFYDYYDYDYYYHSIAYQHKGRKHGVIMYPAFPLKKHTNIFCHNLYDT